jgi:hypothetical protein
MQPEEQTYLKSSYYLDSMDFYTPYCYYVSIAFLKTNFLSLEISVSTLLQQMLKHLHPLIRHHNYLSLQVTDKLISFHCWSQVSVYCLSFNYMIHHHRYWMLVFIQLSFIVYYLSYNPLETLLLNGSFMGNTCHSNRMKTMVCLLYADSNNYFIYSFCYWNGHHLVTSWKLLVGIDS